MNLELRLTFLLDISLHLVFMLGDQKYMLQIFWGKEIVLIYSAIIQLRFLQVEENPLEKKL